MKYSGSGYDVKPGDLVTAVTIEPIGPVVEVIDDKVEVIAPAGRSQKDWQGLVTSTGDDRLVLLLPDAPEPVAIAPEEVHELDPSVLAPDLAAKFEALRRESAIFAQGAP